MPDYRYVHALRTGQSVRHFGIERILGGEGTHCILYLAFDVRLDRRIVFKEFFPIDFVVRAKDGRAVVPRNDECSGIFTWLRQCFLNENHLLARLRHPAILPVFDLFEEHGTAYVLTEYIEAESLDQQLRKQVHCGETELRSLTLNVLTALQLVHESGHLHQNICPGSLLIQRFKDRNQPIIINFGNLPLAVAKKAKHSEDILDRKYAPFEQYTTNGRQGPWTDLYALGAVLFRAITGAPPENSADRTDMDTVQVLADNPPPGYSRDFLATIDKALRMRREERWQSCQEWIDALLHQPTGTLVRQPWYRRLLAT